jgi:ASC-1-like (ASCH) protein
VLTLKPNWTQAISHVNACINSKEQDGKHGISSYEVVFNMPFNDIDQILPSDLRQCETVKDRRINIRRKSKFKDMLKENGWENEFLQDEEDEKSPTFKRDYPSAANEERQWPRPVVK